MKRLALFLCLGLILQGTLGSTAETSTATTPAPRTDKGWVDRQAAFNERAKKGDVDIVFVGDSITHGWEGAGKTVWDKYYGSRKAMNLGIGGDQTQHVLWRLDNGNLDGIKPKVAVIMIGTNNSGSNTAREIADGNIAIVKKLQAKVPGIKILLLAIFPRGEKPAPVREKLAEASKLAAAEVADGKKVVALDIGSKFTEADGTLTKEIMPDFLHLSPKGYEIEAEALEPKIKELLGN